MTFREYTMYDSVDVPVIPSNAQAVAGYVGGKWPTYFELVKQFPHIPKLSIAISAAENARCLDVETGDATNSEAAAWVKRQHQLGCKRPILYTSVSNWRALEDALKAGGVTRGLPGRRHYRRWSAHYTLIPHRCTRRCGFGFRGKAAATQYTNKALGRNLDASLCAHDFLR